MRYPLCAAWVIFTLSALPLQASAATILGVSWDGSVYSVDSSTGGQSSVGSSGFNGLNSLARNQAGQFYSVAGHPLFDTQSTLLRINPSSGAGTSVSTLTGLAAGSVRALAFSSSDVLFAIVNGGGPTAIGVADDLYTINLSSGISTLIGSTGYTGVQALSFSADGTLFGWDVTQAGLLALDTATGAGSPVSAQPDFGQNDIQSIAFGPDGNLYGARFNLFAIDTSSSSLAQIGGDVLSDLRGIEFLASPNPFPAAALPEPASAVLLGIGMLVAAGLRVRKKRSS